MISKEKDEVIFKVIAVGGSLTLFGIKSSDTRWKFYAELDERSVCDLLPEDERAGLNPFYRSPHMHSIEDALRSIERYDWHKLYPMAVHPEFREVIFAEVQRLGGPLQLERWKNHRNLSGSTLLHDYWTGRSRS